MSWIRMSLRFKFIISQLVAFGRICFSVIVGICFFFITLWRSFEKLIAVRLQSFDRLYLLGMSSVSSCPMPFTTWFILLVLTSPPVLPTTLSHLLRFLSFTQLVYIYPSVILFMFSLFCILNFQDKTSKIWFNPISWSSQFAISLRSRRRLYLGWREKYRGHARSIKKKKKLPKNLTVACHAD